jgi:hypothetical protein
VFPSVRAMISRCAEGKLQGAVQASLGLLSAFAAAIGQCLCSRCLSLIFFHVWFRPRCIWFNF